MAPLSGLVNGYCDSEDFSSVWAASPHAPVSSEVDENGVRIMWGEAFNSDGRQKIDASSLKSLWQFQPEPSICVLDGYFAGVVYHPAKGLIAGGDLLGIFPIYYYKNSNVLLVGSSPEVFKLHPCFTQQFNPRGLVGILLSMHMVGGDTLFKGVQRLQAGHVLVSNNHMEISEVLFYQPPASDRYFNLPFSTHVDLLNEAISDTLKIQVTAGEPYTLLLSGGLDSRMLAGYLKQQDVNFESLTLGIKSDRETKIAGKVAKHLNIRQRIIRNK